MVNQINIFELTKPIYKITKPIRLIELFAGIGSQAKALRNLNIKFEHYKVVEFDKYAISSYNAVHGTNFNDLDITKITGEHLNIVDTENFTYLLTYSFPCQDLSIAGKGAGMSKDNNTRSGLLWEVERLLDECDELPQILLLENVPQVIGEKHFKDFRKWQLKLEKLGYSNYFENLNAKDYGIPQNRNRTFMISILGDYYYEFPKKQKLKLRLRDLLEDEVDEKYYLSDKMIEGMKNTNFSSYKLENKLLNKNSIARTIISRFEGTPQCVEDTNTTLCINSKVNGKQPSLQDRVYDSNGISTAITTSFMPSIIIPEKTKKGYALAEEGDGVYIDRPHQKRGVVQKGLIQTIKTSGADVGVVVKDTRNLKEKLADDLIESGAVKGGEVINHSYAVSRTTDRSPIETTDGIMPTLTTRPDTLGVVVVEHRRDEGIRTFKDDVIGTLRAKEAGGDKVVVTNPPQRIRKLTPKECWRLMGFSDEDFDKAAKVNSNSQLYKQAGNSIVVNVLEKIFKMLF